MAKLEVKTKRLDSNIRFFEIYPETVKDSRRAGLSSTGFLISQTTRKFIEEGGEGVWPEVHPMTLRFDKGYEKDGRLRRRILKPTPFKFLGKFARYRVDKKDMKTQVRFGKSKKGKGGTFDRQLFRIVKRVQLGDKRRVSPGMRRLWGSTRKRKRDIPGRDFFPLRKETRVIETEPRPIYDPVFLKVKTPAPARFEERFLDSLEDNEKKADRRTR